jgi:ligand-binding sensor domain-containing protein
MPLSAQNPYKKKLTATIGLPSNLVYQIYRDSRNFLWFATDAGAARYDGNGFQYYSMNEGLNSNEIIRIHEDKLGRLWFFHLNGSFNYLQNNIIHNAINASFLDSLTNKRFFKRFLGNQIIK